METLWVRARRDSTSVPTWCCGPLCLQRRGGVNHGGTPGQSCGWHREYPDSGSRQHSATHQPRSAAESFRKAYSPDDSDINRWIRQTELDDLICFGLIRIQFSACSVIVTLMSFDEGLMIDST